MVCIEGGKDRETATKRLGNTELLRTVWVI